MRLNTVALLFVASCTAVPQFWSGGSKGLEQTVAKIVKDLHLQPQCSAILKPKATVVSTTVSTSLISTTVSPVVTTSTAYTPYTVLTQTTNYESTTDVLTETSFYDSTVTEVSTVIVPKTSTFVSTPDPFTSTPTVTTVSTLSTVSLTTTYITATVYSGSPMTANPIHQKRGFNPLAQYAITIVESGCAIALSTTVPPRTTTVVKTAVSQSTTTFTSPQTSLVTVGSEVDVVSTQTVTNTIQSTKVVPAVREVTTTLQSAQSTTIIVSSIAPTPIVTASDPITVFTSTQIVYTTTSTVTSVSTVTNPAPVCTPLDASSVSLPYSLNGYGSSGSLGFQYRYTGLTPNASYYIRSGTTLVATGGNTQVSLEGMANGVSLDSYVTADNAGRILISAAGTVTCLGTSCTGSVAYKTRAYLASACPDASDASYNVPFY